MIISCKNQGESVQRMVLSNTIKVDMEKSTKHMKCFRGENLKTVFCSKDLLLNCLFGIGSMFSKKKNFYVVSLL